MSRNVDDFSRHLTRTFVHYYRTLVYPVPDVIPQIRLLLGLAIIETLIMLMSARRKGNSFRISGKVTTFISG